MADDHIVPTDCFEQEEWRAIPDLPYFEVSSLGRVRSVERMIAIHHHGRVSYKLCKTRIRAQTLSRGKGWQYFVFNGGIGETNYRYNRAVCAAFNGPPPTDKHEAAHIDGNSLNNLPSNLAWKTPAENGADKILHGTSGRGVRHPKSKFSDIDIKDIFKAYANGALLTEIAKAFGVDNSTVGSVIRRETWAHVYVEPELIAKARFMAIENHRVAVIARNKAGAGKRSKCLSHKE